MVKGIPSDELMRAKDDTARQFPKTFTPTGRISSRLRLLESLLVYALPDDYYANYATATQAVSSATSSALRTIHWSRPSHDRDRRRPEAIEPSIRALNLGSITALSIDEVFAPAR